MATDINNRGGDFSLREVVAELDGFKELVNARLLDVARLADERNLRYEESFRNVKEAAFSALTAAEKQTTAAFLASEKAIAKAEATSTANDAKNNEFRAQLKDQAGTFMPRSESDAKHQSASDKMEVFREDLEKYKQLQAVEIRSLRESRSTATGALSAVTWIIGIAALCLGTVIGHLWK